MNGAILLLLAMAGPPPAWEMVELDLDLMVRPETGDLLGSGVARLRRGAGPPADLVLELAAPCRFDSISAGAGATAEIDSAGGAAVVRLAGLPAPGEEIRVTFGFASHGRGFQVVVDPRGALASWAAGWYPSPAGASPAAPGTTRIRVPRAWRTISNGRLVEEVEDGDGRVETWRCETAAARSFAAGPYAAERREAGARVISVYLLDRDGARAATCAESLARALAALESRFGPYPYPSFAMVEIPAGLVAWGGSSEQGFFMATADAFGEEGVPLPLFAHELAHGWWGNLVRSGEPAALMADEALAQCSAVLAIEAIEGAARATEFLRFSRPGYSPVQCARGFFDLVRDGHDKPLAALTGEGQDHDLADAKGHWFYHMLREEVGDARFFGTLRRLLERHAGGVMSLADIRTAFLESAPPGAGLDAFLAQWLDRAGAPVLACDWEDTTIAGRDLARVTIRQEQEGEPYRLRLEVAIRSASGARLDTVLVSAREETFLVAADGRPTVEVVLDPEHRLLLWDPAYGLAPAVTAEADRLFRDEDWSGAAVAFESLAARFPGDGRAWSKLGTARYRQGDYGGAIAALERAVERDYRRVSGMYRIACSYSLMRDGDRAIAWLERAIAAGFSDRERLRTDHDLDGVRGDPRFGALLEDRR